MRSLLASTSLLILLAPHLLSACSDQSSASPNTADASTDGANAVDGANADVTTNADANADAATATSCPARVQNQLDPLPIMLTAYDSVPNVGFPGVLAEILRRSDESVITSGTTDQSGKVTVNAPVGGVPLEVFVRLTAPADAGAPYMVTRAETEGDFQGNARQLRVFQTTVLQDRAVSAGKTWDPTKAAVDVTVVGCVPDTKTNPPSITGATIVVEPGSQVVYMTDPVKFDLNATSTTPLGRGTDFGVTPGPITIRATKNGVTHSYSTKVIAGQNLILVFAPF
jgi:hypothetical protein